MQFTKGFAWLPILIILGLVIVGGGSYFAMHQSPQAQAPIYQDQTTTTTTAKAPPATGLVITYPSTGTTLSAGQQVTIRWSIPSSVISSFPADFTLGLFLNVIRTDAPAVNVYGINDGTNNPSAGSVVWTVPADIAPGTYKIEAYLNAQPKDAKRNCAVTVGKDCSPNAADAAVMARASQYKAESGEFTVKASQNVSVPGMSKYTDTNFSASPTSGKVPLKVIFTCNNNVRINFGDGQFGGPTLDAESVTPRTYTHTYAQPGTYITQAGGDTITITVTQ